MDCGPGTMHPPAARLQGLRGKQTQWSLEALTRAFLPSARARMSRSGFCGRIFQASPEAQSCLRPADGSHKGDGSHKKATDRTRARGSGTGEGVVEGVVMG